LETEEKKQENPVIKNWYLEWSTRFKPLVFTLFFFYHLLIFTTGPLGILVVYMMEGKGMTKNM